MNSWFHTIKKNADLVALGAVAVIYAAYRATANRRHTATLADALQDVSSAKADIVPRGPRDYADELKHMSKELHQICAAAPDVAALRQALFRYSPGPTGRVIRTEHVIRSDGEVRASIGEIAAAIAAKHSWWDFVASRKRSESQRRSRADRNSRARTVQKTTPSGEAGKGKGMGKGGAKGGGGRMHSRKRRGIRGQ